MENEELFAGETEADAQRLILEGDSSTEDRRTAPNATKGAVHLRFREESPLLTDNIHGSGDEERHEEYIAFETDSRPSWPSVSDSQSLLHPMVTRHTRSGGCCHSSSSSRSALVDSQFPGSI